MSMNRVAALRLEVEAAERDATAARAQLVAGGGELSDRIRKHWVPRGLVGAGALLGYWFEGHLNGGSGRSASAHDERERPSGNQSKDDSVGVSPGGIAGWLGLAISALRLAETLKPLIDRTMASSDASDESMSKAQSASSDRKAELQGESMKVSGRDAHADPQKNLEPRNHVELQR